jgi:hypothetical protein
MSVFIFGNDISDTFQSLSYLSRLQQVILQYAGRTTVMMSENQPFSLPVFNYEEQCDVASL